MEDQRDWRKRTRYTKESMLHNALVEEEHKLERQAMIFLLCFFFGVLAWLGAWVLLFNYWFGFL
jgi:hypothetical protein